MKHTVNGTTFEMDFRTHEAPKDANGNVRYDVEVLINGQPLKDTLKGYRRVKNGYRTQYGAHGYNMQTMLDDIAQAVLNSMEPTQPKTTSHGTVSSTHATVVKKIQDHILESLSDDYGTEPKQQLESVVAGFRHWYGAYERRQQQNVQRAFMDWLSCLPSQIDAEYRTGEQERILVEWLGESRKEFTDMQIGERYYQLMFREFQKLCKKYGTQDLYGRSSN